MNEEWNRQWRQEMALVELHLAVRIQDHVTVAANWNMNASETVHQRIVDVIQVGGAGDDVWPPNEWSGGSSSFRAIFSSNAGQTVTARLAKLGNGATASPEWFSFFKFNFAIPFIFELLLSFFYSPIIWIWIVQF